MMILLLFINIIYGFIYPYNILCPNKQSSDRLIYLICSFDKYCSEIYDIPFIENYGYIPSNIEQTLTFKNFNYMIRNTGLSYPLSITTYLNDNNRKIVLNQYNLENGLYYKIWSTTWRRVLLRINFIVFENPNIKLINSTQNTNLLISENTFKLYDSTFFLNNLYSFNKDYNQCIYVDNSEMLSSESMINTTDYLYNNFFNMTPNSFYDKMNQTEYLNIFENTDTKSTNIILSTLYILTLYKEHISLDSTCNDINERLYLDPTQNELRCVCLEGKSCDSESKDTATILWIAIMFFGIVIIVAIAILYSIFVLLTNEKKSKRS